MENNRATKKTREQSEMYREMKRSFNTSLTPTAIELLKDKAKASGLSASEYIERVARSPVTPELSAPPENYDYSQFERVVKEAGGGEEMKAAIALIEKYNLVSEWLSRIQSDK